MKDSADRSGSGKLRSPGTRRWIVLFALVLALVGMTGLTWRGLQQRYISPDGIAIGKRFLQLVADQKWAEAFDLTTRTGSVGESLDQFTEGLQQHLALERGSTIRFVGQRGGYQTYQNRLHRWLLRQSLEMNPLRLEYAAPVPVEVKLTLTEAGWKVAGFRAHAG